MKVNRREFLVVGTAGVAGAVGAVGCRSSAPETARSGKVDLLEGKRLAIEFTGLAAVVSRANDVAILLVDAEKALTPVVPHVAQLRVHPDLVVLADSSAKDGQDAIDLVMWPFWNLKGYRVTVTTEGPAGLSRVNGHHDPATTKVPGNDTAVQSDVDWLVNMKQIPAAGNGQIAAACLAADPRPAKISSRLDFTRGQLHSRFRAKYKDVKWRIGTASDSGTIERAISEVGLSQPLTGDKITFTLEPFDASVGSSKTVVLKANATGPTVVQIRNVPDPAHQICAGDDDVRNLHHFHAYYQLLSTPMDGPIPICPPPDCNLLCKPAEGEPVYCPPTEYPPPSP